MDVEVAEGHADHAMDLADVFLALGEAAEEQERGVVLIFDEVQFLGKTQLEALVRALHEVVQSELTITLVSAGLPQIAELARNAKSYAEPSSNSPVSATSIR